MPLHRLLDCSGNRHQVRPCTRVLARSACDFDPRAIGNNEHRFIATVSGCPQTRQEMTVGVATHSQSVDGLPPSERDGNVVSP